ncbi:unnamed protein product [Rhizophagus irregularis]|uniref:Uncharacterized protein n=1 Tax=Rhizophagus irregularis TaxID=588596 RepID=A0A916E2X9_9GLOM|nr:unnamed protein product [Rhizophagus irregularis]CAB5345950.1 unnamed protein product [Rhizophagus irregularis]
MYNNFRDIETTMELKNDLEKDNLDNLATLATHLARTSGNIFQIDNDEKVSSVLKEVKKRGREKKEKLNKAISLENELLKKYVTDKEPWVSSDYERNSYCLYHNQKGTEVETLQLIVGKPFLEYIWINGIPVNQEREKTRIRIEEFKYSGKLNDFKLNDFCLKVYRYEKVSKDKSKDELDKLEIEKDDIEIIRMEKERTEKKKGSEVIIEMEKIIRQQDIFDKANAVRRVCKALEFINKRKKFLCEEMVAYINCIIWRFIKYKPDDFKLLDVQRNVMKNLVLGREIKGTIIVAYLLEYYSRHPTDYAGWMSTVSKTLPLLFKYNYVPLPEFTINNHASQQNKPGRGYFILNLFLTLFIPRWYSISWKEKNKLIPFARVVYYENNDDIYDNPATEAIIDFCWERARTFFFSLFLRFLLYLLFWINYFFIWIEVISYLRLIPNIAIYIYYIIKPC